MVAQQIVKVALARLLSIGAPGVSNACRLLDSHAVPAFGERGCKDGCMKFIRQFLGTEERHVLLAEREVGLSELVQGSQLACVRCFQPDMRHGFGDLLWRAWYRPGLFPLFHLAVLFPVGLLMPAL